MPLQRVDHGDAFVDVIERQGDQQDPGADRGRDGRRATRLPSPVASVPAGRSVGSPGALGEDPAGTHRIADLMNPQVRHSAMGCEAEQNLVRGHRSAGADLPVPCQGQALDRPAPPPPGRGTWWLCHGDRSPGPSAGIPIWAGRGLLGSITRARRRAAGCGLRSTAIERGLTVSWSPAWSGAAGGVEVRARVAGVQTVVGRRCPGRGSRAWARADFPPLCG